MPCPEYQQFSIFNFNLFVYGSSKFWLEAAALRKLEGFIIIVWKQQTHLNNVPVVCELIQVGAVEAERCERGGGQDIVIAGLLQGGQLVWGKPCHGGEQKANIVHVLHSCFLAPYWPAAQRWPGEQVIKLSVSLIIIKTNQCDWFPNHFITHIYSFWYVRILDVFYNSMILATVVNRPTVVKNSSLSRGKDRFFMFY